jgi:hypothetical protein
MLLKAPPGERPALFRETKDRLLAKSHRAIFSSKPLPPIATLGPKNPPEAIVRYGYRSFDRAWAIADGRVCSRTSSPLVADL